MRFRVCLHSHDPEQNRVVDADTGELVQGVMSIKLSADVKRTSLVLEIADFEVDFEGEPTKTFTVCAFCRREVPIPLSEEGSP